MGIPNYKGYADQKKESTPVLAYNKKGIVLLFVNLTSAFSADYVSGTIENVLQMLTHLILLTTQ